MWGQCPLELCSGMLQTRKTHEARLSRVGERTKSTNGFAPELGVIDVKED